MIEKILIPLDGSKLAEKALPYAEVLAEKFEAELILLQVLETVVVLPEFSDVSLYEAKVIHAEVEAQTYLDRVLSRFANLGVPVHTYFLEGNSVGETILTLACERGVDLIVMSSHGRSGPSQWICGSVANKILQHAPCPVFLVKTTRSEC